MVCLPVPPLPPLESISYKATSGLDKTSAKYPLLSNAATPMLAAIGSNATGGCTGSCTYILHSNFILLEVKRNSARAGGSHVSGCTVWDNQIYQQPTRESVSPLV